MKEKINVIKDNKKDSGLRFPTNTSLILFFLKGSIFYFTAGAVFACLVALFDLIIPAQVAVEACGVHRFLEGHENVVEVDGRRSNGGSAEPLRVQGEQ